MGTPTANGAPLLSCQISEPRTGVWVASDVHVDLAPGDELATSVTLDFDGVAEFVGTVIRGGNDFARGKALIVGGAGGLRDELPSKYYSTTTVQTIVADIMRESGETLDTAGSDVALLTKQVDAWHRSKDSGSAALGRLMEKAGGFWRMGRNGRVLILASEAWPDSDSEFDTIDTDTAHGTITVAPRSNAPDIEPGTKAGGQNVSAVLSHVDGGSVRQVLRIESTDTGADRDRSMWGAIRAMVLGIVRPQVDYLRNYPAKVVAQNGSTLEVLPDDPRVRGNGITLVQLRHGMPGVTVQVVAGSRCNVFFENGDPSKPCASLWPDGSTVSQIVLANAAGSAQFVALSNLVDSRCGAIETKLNSFITKYNTHAHTGVTTGGGTSGTTPAVETSIASGTSTAAAKVKAE